MRSSSYYLLDVLQEDEDKSKSDIIAEKLYRPHTQAHPSFLKTGLPTDFISDDYSLIETRNVYAWECQNIPTGPFGGSGSTAVVAIFSTRLYVLVHGAYPILKDSFRMIAEVELSRKAVYVHDVEHNSWLLPESSGDVPQIRKEHCAVFLPSGFMWTFGGTYNGESFNETHLWKFETAEWKRLKDRICPQPRHGAQALWVKSEGKEGSVILFGGRDSLKSFDDLWIWDFSTEMWTNPVVISTAGPCPVIDGHVIAGTRGGKLLIWGNKTCKNCYQINHQAKGKVADINDAFMLDVSQKELSRPNNHLLKVLGKQDCSKSLSGTKYNFLLTISRDGEAQLVEGIEWTWNLGADEYSSNYIQSYLKTSNCSFDKVLNYLTQEKSILKCQKKREIILSAASALETLLSPKQKMDTQNIDVCHIALKIDTRLFLLGGMNLDMTVDLLFILCLELDGELRLIKNEEIHASLQRERILQQNKEMEEKQSAFRAEERQKAEQARKNKIEKDEMRIEDYLSGLAPKTTAPAVTLQAAYPGKLCVGWPKVSRNSRGNPVGGIVYRLFARGRIINVGNPSSVSTEYAYKVVIDWELVFSGKGVNSFLYEAIPSYLLEKEPGISASVDFFLQTVGTEEPTDEPSYPSEVKRFHMPCMRKNFKSDIRYAKLESNDTNEQFKALDSSSPRRNASEETVGTGMNYF